MKKFKIDIYNLEENFSHSSSRIYFGSILFESSWNNKSVNDFLLHAGGEMINEGIEMLTFNFPDYTVIQLTDFGREGNFYQELIYSNKNFQIKNELFSDNQFTINDDDEYLIIGDDTTDELLSEDDLKFFKDYQGNLIKTEYHYEWGASGFWENYIIGIASSLTVEVISRLVSIGFPKKSIRKFKLPSKIKNFLSEEYQIDPKSLFMESYSNKDGIIEANFRNVKFRFELRIKDGELVDLKTEKLDKLI